MLSFNALDPKNVSMLHDEEHAPTLNEQATRLLLHKKHHSFVQTWINPLVCLLLRSRLHWLLSNSVMLITFCGHKSGRFITTPVNYVAGPDGLFYSISAPGRTWWRNLLGGAPVTIVFKGSSLDGFGTAIMEPQAVGTELTGLVEYAPSYRKVLALGLTSQGTLRPADVARAAQQHVVVRVQLH